MNQGRKEEDQPRTGHLTRHALSLLHGNPILHQESQGSPPSYRTTGAHGTDQHGDHQQQEDSDINPKYQGGAGSG